MASLEPHYGNYRLVFRYNGKKFSRSLHTDDEGAAIAAKATAEQRIKLIRSNVLPEPPSGCDVFEYLVRGSHIQVETKNEDIVAKKEKLNSFGQLCSSFFENFLRSSIEENSFKTIELHSRHLQRIFGADKPIIGLDQSAVQEYVAKRSKEPGIRGARLSPNTIKKEISTLKSILSWAMEVGHIDKVFETKRLRFPKGKEKPPFQTFDVIVRKVRHGKLNNYQQAELWECLFLSTTEIAQLLSDVRLQARHPFIYPMFMFAAHTGARRSEILRAEFDDLDMESRLISVREKKRVKGSLSTRRVPMSKQLHKAMKEWLQIHPGGDTLFCFGTDRVTRSKKNRKKCEPITRDEVHDHFKTTLAKTKWSNVCGWHTLRHSFCSNCAAAGVEQRVINSWVGHQTEEMERRYRHLFPNLEKKAICRVFD